MNKVNKMKKLKNENMISMMIIINLKYLTISEKNN